MGRKGRRHRTLRLVVVACSLLSAVAVEVARPVPHAAAAPVTLPAGASQYRAVAALRLADTRGAGFGFTNIGDNTIRIDVRHRQGIPSNATAAVLNVTIAGAGASGYLTVYPSGTARPPTSNVNADVTGRVIANMVHVTIGADGAVAVYNAVAGPIVVDLVGVYVPVTTAVSDGRLVTIESGSTRVYDTRQPGGSPMASGSTRDVSVAAAGVPDDASAVVVNVTGIGGVPGFWSAYESGVNWPGTSTTNIDANGQVRAAQAIVPLRNGAKTIRLYTTAGGHVIVDVAGWYTGASAPAGTDGLFVPAESPQRLFDSRWRNTLAPWSGSTFEFGVNAPGFGVSAVALNLTATDPWANGYLTAYPAGVTRPNSSNLNISAWPQTTANHAIVRVSERGIAVYTFGGVQIIVDLAGWFLGTPTVPTLPTPSNPAFIPSPPVRLVVPKLGINVAVQEGDNLDTVADRNVAAVAPGADIPARAHLMFFGHRTKGKGIFLHLDLLLPGDTFTVTTQDGHSFLYLVVARDITTPAPSAVFGLSYPWGPITLQLVTCSDRYGRPGSLQYRVVVTARLLGPA